MYTWAIIQKRESLAGRCGFARETRQTIRLIIRAIPRAYTIRACARVRINVNSVLLIILGGLVSDMCLSARAFRGRVYSALMVRMPVKEGAGLS